MTELPVERNTENGSCCWRLRLQQCRENSDFNEERQSRGRYCYRFCRIIKTRCSRCCVFSYKNIAQLNATVCFLTILLSGILKIVFGSVSLSSGQIAIILAKQDNLHWSGLFLVRTFCYVMLAQVCS